MKLLAAQVLAGLRRGAVPGPPAGCPVLESYGATAPERVGREWSAEVVGTEATPDYGAAYEELESLLEGLGIAFSELDLAALVVTSVATSEGPGLSLSIDQRVEDDPASGDPELDHPGSDHSGSDHPGSDHPGTDQPESFPKT